MCSFKKIGVTGFSFLALLFSCDRHIAWLQHLGCLFRSRRLRLKHRPGNQSLVRNVCVFSCWPDSRRPKTPMYQIFESAFPAAIVLRLLVNPCNTRNPDRNKIGTRFVAGLVAGSERNVGELTSQSPTQKSRGHSVDRVRTCIHYSGGRGWACRSLREPLTVRCVIDRPKKSSRKLTSAGLSTSREHVNE